MRTGLSGSCPGQGVLRIGASEAETISALEQAAGDENLSVRLAAEKALRELRKHPPSTSDPVDEDR